MSTVSSASSSSAAAPVEGVAHLPVGGRGPAPGVGAHVVAEDHALEVAEQAHRLRLAVEGGPALGELHDGLLRGVGRARGVGVRQGFEPQQRLAGAHLVVRGHQQFLDPAGERRGQQGLHLHALEHHHGCAGRDLVADRGGDRHDEGRCGRAQHAALVLGDAVDGAVDLDQVVRGVRGGHDAVRHALDDQPHGVALELLDDRVDLVPSTVTR